MGNYRPEVLEFTVCSRQREEPSTGQHVFKNRHNLRPVRVLQLTAHCPLHTAVL